MKTIRTKGVMHAKSNRECRKLISLLETGKARVMREFVDGKKVISIISLSGALQATVDPKYAYQFGSFFDAHGAGDGLFLGFDQTAGPRP